MWNLRDYAFLQQDTAPATVNPSLWRQAQLNYVNGLFKVTDGLYQIRGFDLANMTIVEGRRGLIVIDPLTTVEVAQAALSLYFQHRPQRAVVAVVYTHSHADHFGGVKGVISDPNPSMRRPALPARCRGARSRRCTDLVRQLRRPKAGRLGRGSCPPSTFRLTSDASGDTWLIQGRLIRR